jgi:hypothetical protein
MMICQAQNRVGRLNAFQRVMLQWTELSPYNAVHVYRLAGAADPLALAESLRATFEHSDIGAVEINEQEACYRHVCDPRPTVEIVGGRGPAEARLSAHVAAEVNRPFARPVCKPFRVSLLDAGPESHYVILAYDHWASDSNGARLLMRHVLGRYLNLDIPENQTSLDLYPGTYGEVFSQRLGGPRLAMPLLRSAFSAMMHRSARQTAYASNFQMSVGYDSYDVRPGTIEAVHQFARRNNASVHDVFLAAMGVVLADMLPRRAKSGAIALGTIVDTRNDAQEDLSDTLGTFLGYYVTRLAGDRSIGFDELVRRVAEKTSKVKRQRSYLDAAVNFRVSSQIWPRLRPESRPLFARRALPMTAGVTNVFLRDSWINHYGGGKILEYRRAVSCGPALPLVLSPTTYDGRLNIGVNYRETVFSRAKITAIMASLVERLETVDSVKRRKKPALRSVA